MLHETYRLKSWADVESTGLFLPASDDIKSLFTELKIHARTAPNRIALQPMEGSDGTLDGAPDELTARRYKRFARGGAGLIWFEAVACAPEARASARQLMITENNADAYKRLLNDIREISVKQNGCAPVIIMQATHSGRYAKPEGAPAPLIAYNNPVLEPTPIDKSRILSDDELKRYEARYADMARLAARAGFDGMDVKCCHRYLANELLSAYTRPGEYGGSFENRTRFIVNAFAAARSGVSANELFLTTRLNAYDGFEYPWGFGVSPGGGLEPDLSEAIKLTGILKQKFGAELINITIGNPYKNPHVNRPYDRGAYVPDEHPLEGVSRMMRCVSGVQTAHPDVSVVGSAFSYLRGLSPTLAAGMIAGGHARMAGFGRLAIAYPDFPNDLRLKGALDPARVCLTCGLCAELLRAGKPAGCAMRDREVYKPLFKE